MQTLYRTTITIPKNLYQKTKVRAAYQNKSLSKFITELLEKNIVLKFKPPLPFGKYSLGIQKKITRDDIYGDYLKRKVSR
jgi:hypothetical protein